MGCVSACSVVASEGYARREGRKPWFDLMRFMAKHHDEIGGLGAERGVCMVLGVRLVFGRVGL
jgi:hypothetical protein